SVNVSANIFSDDLAASPALQKMATGWPWPRDVHAMILNRLAQAGARVIAFDLLFPTPREGDAELRAALDQWRDRVVIGSNFVDDQSGDGAKHTITLPSPDLIPDAENDERVGFVNFWPDVQDGIVRLARYRVPASEALHMPAAENERVFESFAARILQKLGRTDRIPGGAKFLRFAPDAEQGGFRPISAYTIFVPDLWRANFQSGEFFRDKIVVVGPYGNFLKDALPTPFGMMDGPELHINAINDALSGDFITEPTPMEQAVLILGAGFLALAFSFILENPQMRFVGLVVLSAGWLAATAVLYNKANHLVLVLSTILTFDCGGLGALAWQHFLDRRERARVRRIFERFVSKNVVKEVVDNRDSFLNQLGGVRKQVAVLMSDLRGFTTLTEQSDSTQLVAQLNEYLTEMVKCVFATNGTVDKFIGDAVLAVWGDIHSEGAARDAELAVSTALRMQQSLDQLNVEWRKRGRPELAMGIGINHGEVIFGAIGSEQKSEPTVIGDTVNLASRLEGITKEYGVPLILGESVAALVRDKLRLQFVDCVRVKGKTRPIEVFTVLDAHDEKLSAQTERYLEAYNRAVEKYRAGDFDEAQTLFDECLSLRKDDPLAALYAKRCADLHAQPPDVSWDGVFVMTTK